MKASANIQLMPRRSARSLLALLLGVVLGGIVALTLTQTPAQATPSNDNLSGAKNMGRSTGFGDPYEVNYGATMEPGEPVINRYNSVWYKWTPSIDGRVYILVYPNRIDTKVSVWTGPQSDVRRLRLKAANDDFWYAGRWASKVEFPVQGGTPLWIAVSSYWPGRLQEGRFVIEGYYTSLRNL